jgi:hypothetical protein
MRNAQDRGKTDIGLFSRALVSSAQAAHRLPTFSRAGTLKDQKQASGAMYCPFRAAIIALLCASAVPRTASALSRIQDGRADTSTSSRYIEIGTAVMGGFYTVITDSSVTGRAQRLLRRPHQYHAIGLSLGVRRDRPNLSIGLRGRVFTGSDHGELRKSENGFINARPEDAPFTVDVKGGSAVIDVDTKIFGLSAGILAGHLLEGEKHISSPRAVGGVRFGLLSQLYAEVAIADHSPSPVPYPMLKASFVVVGEGAASYRFGAANAGPFVEALVVTKNGWLFDPFVSAGESGGFIGSIRIAKRLRF